MPQAMRRNADFVDGFGVAVTTPIHSVYVNNELAMVVGGFVTPHHTPISPDQPAPMVEGSHNVFAENRPICRIGDAAQCGHRCISGSPNVIVN